MSYPAHNKIQSVFRKRKPGAVSTRHAWSPFVWLIVGITLIAGIWIYAESRLAAAKEELRQKVYTQVESQADLYAEQLNRFMEQIDQLTLFLKINREEPHTAFELENLDEKGLFPSNLLMHSTVIDANGNIISSSIDRGKDINFSQSPVFLFHKLNNTGKLEITGPSPGPRTGRILIRFSRRVNAPDGSFNGIVVILIEPSQLLPFPSNESLDPGEFISVRFLNGPVLADQTGGELDSVYREPPSFMTASGTALEPGNKFRDNRSRIVAWQINGKYPLITIAGVSEESAFAGYSKIAATFRMGALAGSLIIICFTLAGIMISSRLAWRRRREEEAKETLRLATDAANDGFFAIRPVYGEGGAITDFIYEDCNERGAQLLGMVRETLMGRRLSELMPNGYKGDIEEVLKHTLEVGFHEDEIRVSKTSPVKAAWVYRRLIRSGNVVALTMRDISKSKEHEHALAKLANTDALTTLPNRHWLAGFLPDELEQARAGNYPLAILFIDLDNFKNINDTLGHDAGDELLVAAALRLKSVVRASDHVVRLGGDEFTVILKHVHGIDDIAHVAQSIVRTIGEPFTLTAAAGQRVNASIGVSIFPQDGEDGETLLKHADIAMYAAKAAGKGRFYFYQSHFSDSLMLKLNKEKALQEAVEQDQFVVHYQPRIRVDTGRLSSMEALIRWQHPERGLVYPVEFIDMAEDNGLILRIGELVIEKVCAQIAAWQRQNLFLVPVSINVSGLQLKEGNVSRYLTDCMLRHGIKPEAIEIELTESSVIDRSVVVLDELARLRDLGIKLLIDDFGTGYSSLAQLHQIDVDVLKVDHVFTAELNRESGAEVLFRAILSMASELDIRVVAEGVETTDQLRTLKKLSCYEAQGYLISRAVTAAEMQVMLLKRLLFPTAALSGPSAV